MATLRDAWPKVGTRPGRLVTSEQLQGGPRQTPMGTTSFGPNAPACLRIRDRIAVPVDGL